MLYLPLYIRVFAQTPNHPIFVGMSHEIDENAGGAYANEDESWRFSVDLWMFIANLG